MFTIISVCKGGGYKYCRTSPPHPKQNAKGLYPLHRVLLENKLGRLLLDGEEAHHIDEDKNNDSPENLELKTKSEHVRHHHPKKELVTIQCKCGKSFSLTPHQLRQRKERSKYGPFCSRQCSGAFS
jgi:HNH endonuclease